jgi:hypothetical protein
LADNPAASRGTTTRPSPNASSSATDNTYDTTSADDTWSDLNSSSSRTKHEHATKASRSNTNDANDQPTNDATSSNQRSAASC